MRVAHFIQRYPPALGGSEAYFARLSRYLARRGDDVTVFTTNALDLEAFWSRRGRCCRRGVSREDGVTVHRLSTLALARPPLAAQAVVAHPTPALAMPDVAVQSRSCPGCGASGERPGGVRRRPRRRRFRTPGRSRVRWRLARRLRVPFFLTPFLHLGDPRRPGRPHAPRLHVAAAALAAARRPTSSSCRHRANATRCSAWASRRTRRPARARRRRGGMHRRRSRRDARQAWACRSG